MKLTIQSYQPVAVWKWNLVPASEASPADQAAKLDDKLNSLAPAGEAEEEEDVCGICRVAFEGCCPECKKPGDDCPLNMHCLLRWLGTESSKNCCPLDRRPWVTAEAKAPSTPAPVVA